MIQADRQFKSEAYMKKEKLSVKDLCLTAIFITLTIIFAQISIPVPFSPIPISFCMIGVYTAAIFLNPRCAILSQVCYLLLGAAGVPVFGGFRGGMGALVGPTGGYLIVYPIMAAIVSFALNDRRVLLAKYKEPRVMLNGALAICLAHLLLYVTGTAWLSITTGNTFMAALFMAVIPYIPMDIFKIAFCVFAIIPMRRRFLNMGLLNLSTHTS